MADVCVSSLLTDYDANLAAVTDLAVNSLVNSHIPLLGHLCGDLPDKVIWKMMYLSYHQLRVQDRCTMLSVVTDYIIHSPVLQKTSVTSTTGTSPTDIIRVLAQCWQNILPSGKRGLDVQSFHNITITLTRCVSQLRTYRLHDPFKVVLKQAMRLKKQTRPDIDTMSFPARIEPNFPRIAEMSHNKMRKFRSHANLAHVAATLPTCPTRAHEKLPPQIRPVYQPSTIRQKVSTPLRRPQPLRPQPPRSTNVRKGPCVPGNVNGPAQTNPSNDISAASPVIRITHILARKVLPAPAQRNTDISIVKLVPPPRSPPAPTRKIPSTQAKPNSSTPVRKMFPRNLPPQARQIPLPVYTSNLAAQSPSLMAPTSSPNPSVQAHQISSAPFLTKTSTMSQPSLFVTAHVHPPARQIPSTYTQPFTPVLTLARQNPTSSATKPPSSPYRQSTTGKGIPSSRHSMSLPVRQATPLSPETARYSLQQRRPHTPISHQPTSSMKTPVAPHITPQRTPSACVDSSPQCSKRLSSNQRLLIHAELKRLHLVSSSPAMPLHTPRMTPASYKRPNTPVAASEASVPHPTKKRLVEAKESLYRQTQGSTLHPADRTVTKELFFN